MKPELKLQTLFARVNPLKIVFATPNLVEGQLKKNVPAQMEILHVIITSAQNWKNVNLLLVQKKLLTGNFQKILYVN